MVLFPLRILYQFESIYLTAFINSTIHPSKEDVATSKFVDKRTPNVSLENIHIPYSKSPLITTLSWSLSGVEKCFPGPSGEGVNPSPTLIPC
jgi:hypothetical protein